MSVYFYPFIDSITHHRFTVTLFLSLDFTFFYSPENKHTFLPFDHGASSLTNELVEESEQFRLLKTSCFVNLKGVVGLIMVKSSDMHVAIPLDLSSRSFIPIPRFIRSCRPVPFLTPSLVLFLPCPA